MTKYILHGGFNKEKGFIKDEFFREMLRDTGKDVKVLLVYFAESEEMQPIRIEQGVEQFERNKDLKNLDIRVASENSFVEDCAWADVIYFSGGRTVRLMEILKKYPNLKELLQNKTVGGDSAGANMLGHYFYSKRSKEIGEGFKIIPYKILVHYEDGTPNPLADSEPDMETLFIREYETVVKNV